MKKIIALLAAAILTAGLFSCGRTSTKTKELNDWQKELLAAEGLPTEADELTDSQLHSIQRIYEMITYLNEKYDEEFIYGGYLEPAVNQTETLYAYPRLLGADYGRNTVTVRATKDGFTDDYSDRSIVDYYNELVTDFIHDYFNSDDFAVFISVNACNITKGEVVNGDFQWKIGVHDAIFLNEKICSADSIEKFAVNFAKFLYEHKMDGRHRINIIRNIDISEITFGNHTEYYSGDNYIGYYDFGFDSDKKNVFQSEFLSGQRILNDYTIEEYFSKYN